MTVPPYEDAQRCIEARKLSKRGHALNNETKDFVTQMFELYPDWYKATEQEIFDSTKPFGADGWPK